MMRTLLFILATSLGVAQIPFPGPGRAQAGGAVSFYSRSLTVDHTKVPNTDQTNFPVLIRTLIGTVNTTSVANAVTLTAGDSFPTYMDSGYPIRINGTIYSIATRVSGSALTLTTSPGIQTGVAYSNTPFLATVANGGLVQDAQGDDIRFGTSDTCGTLLDYEMVTWSATTGVGEWWVRAGTLPTATDYVGYNCYGNAAWTTDASNPTAVWAYSAYHLPNGSTLTSNDSNGAANGTNGMTSAATAGKIDGGALFDGGGPSTSTISIANNASNEAQSTQSMCIWFKQASGSGQTRFFHNRDGATGMTFMINGGAFQATYYGVADLNASSGTSDTANFHHVCFVNNAGTYTFYLDGAANGTGSVGGSPNASGQPMLLGNVNSNGDIMDEALLAGGVALSADWIATMYNNQFDPGSFEAWGSEVSH